MKQSKLTFGALALLGLVTVPANSATYLNQDWIKYFGDAGAYFSNTNVDVDTAGNSYIVGYYRPGLSGIVDFDPGPGTDLRSGEGTFLTRINADGSYGWTKTNLGGSPSAITVDNQGDVYITGNYTGSVDFDPGPGQDIRTKALVNCLMQPTTPAFEVFITRINADGSYGWTKTFGDAPGETGTRVSSSSIAVSSNGELYVGGYIGNCGAGSNSGVDFDPGPGNDFHGGRSGYLTKLNADGSYAWTRTFFLGYLEGIRSVATNNGEVYVTGRMDSGETYLGQVHADGNAGWTRTFAGPNSAGNAVAADSQGNAYVTGYFQGSNVDFNSDPVGVDSYTTAFGQDIFVTRYNADGSYGWTRVMAQVFPLPAQTFGGHMGAAIALNGSLNVLYVAGQFQGSVDFDPGPGTHILTPTGTAPPGFTNNNIFITRLLTDGSYEWTERITDSLPLMWHDMVAADAAGSAYLTGQVISGASFLAKFSPSETLPSTTTTITTTTLTSSTLTTTTTTASTTTTTRFGEFPPACGFCHSVPTPRPAQGPNTCSPSFDATKQVVEAFKASFLDSTITGEEIAAIVAFQCGSSGGVTTTSTAPPTTTTLASTTTTTASAGNGQSLYNSMCAGCHSGTATGGGGRNIDGARVCSIKGALNGTKVFPTGVPQMAFLKSVLNDTQIQAISDYLNSGSVTGQQRYITACAGCHGVDARGGRVGESVRGENAAEISEAIYDESAMRFLNCLPEGDVGAIGGYLSGSAYSTTTRYATTTTRRSTTTTGSVTTTTKRCSRYDRRCNKPRHDRDDD